MDHFDYKYYLEKYTDLRHLDYDKALNHYITCGKNEGRIAYKKIPNTVTNITVILHLFNTNLFDEMKSYIKNVKDVFSNVNIIISINERSNFKNEIIKIFPNAVVLKVENKGVDIYPFLLSIEYIRKHNIKTDFILKLHTKESTNIVENFKNWRKDLIEPIVNYNNLLIIQNYFKKYKNIGYIASQKCSLPKDFDLDFKHNIKGINNLCNKFPHLEKEWTDFNGGNIFWISNDVLNSYLTPELIKYIIEQLYTGGKLPSNLTDKRIFIEYLCERIFTGIFCYKKTNILVNEFKVKYNPDNMLYYQPRVFSISTPQNIIM